MAILAALIGIIGTVLGLYASIRFDSRSGPSVVVALFILFIASRLISGALKEFSHEPPEAFLPFQTADLSGSSGSSFSVSNG